MNQLFTFLANGSINSNKFDTATMLGYTNVNLGTVSNIVHYWDGTVSNYVGVQGGWSTNETYKHAVWNTNYTDWMSNALYNLLATSDGITHRSGVVTGTTSTNIFTIAVATGKMVTYCFDLLAYSTIGETAYNYRTERLYAQ